MAEDRPAMKDPLRFGVFEIDPSSRELRKHGVRIKLQDQPFAVLLILLEKPGEIVTREELQQRLWPADTFVEFDKGIYNALKRLREALGDSAENPRYVETLPRRGYRFIAPITNSCPIASVDVQSEAAPLNLGQTRSRRITLLASLIAFLVAVSGVAVWRWMARHPGAPRVLGFRQLTHDGQAKEGPLATDGPRVYFNEILPGPHSVVAQVSVHGGESAPLPIQLSQPTVADVSEDGTDLLLENHEEDGESLWIQPVLSGSPRRVGTVLAHDAAFGPGATNVVYGRGNDVYSINGDGGGLRKLLNAGHVAFAFRYSPDRRLLRFTIFDVQIDDMSIIESAAEASAPRKILRGCWGKWTPDGRHFVFQKRHDGRLDFWTLPEMRTTPWAHVDQPQQLTDGPLDYQYPLPSKDGKTIFALGTARRAELVRYDRRTGQFIPFLAGISAEGVAFSSDGQWVAYASFPEGDLWRSKIDGTEKRQLTFPPLRVFGPKCSPDGQQIAFSADAPELSSVRNVYLISSEGGMPKRVLGSEQSQSDPNWSPDGTRLIFGSLFVPNAPIYIFDVRTQSVASVNGSNGTFCPQWSPDGRKIAAAMTNNRRLMLFDVATEKWVEAIGFPVGCPAWSHDGKFIYFKYSRSEGEQRVREGIGRVHVDGGKIENVVDMKDLGRVSTGTLVGWFGLAPDDSPLFARDISAQEIYALEVEWP